MPGDQIPSTSQSAGGIHLSVTDVFARFAERSYAFTPCTNRFEKWIFQRLWILPVLLFGVEIAVAVIVSPTPKSFLFLGGHIWLIDEMAALTVKSTKWLSGPLLGVLSIDAYLLTRFARQAPKSFFTLALAGRLKPGSASPATDASVLAGRDSGLKSRAKALWAKITHSTRLTPRSWQTFADDFERALGSPWRYLLSAVFTITGMALILRLSGVLTNLPFEVWFDHKSVFWPYVLDEVMHRFIAPVLIGYTVGISLWLLFVVGLYISWLTPTFTLDIQPTHGDMCGGFKRVGDQCLQMAVLSTLPAVVFGVWGLIGILQEVVAEVLIGMFLATAVMSVSSFLVFFLPLWRIHSVMVHEKARLQDEAVSRISPIEANLRELAARGALASNEAQTLDSQLKKLRDLYPTGMKYPRWPFETSILLKLFTPQVVPIITLIAGLSDTRASLLDAIIRFFPGLLG